jgi:acyl-coenzyme A thioesterase PaaI-like protein
MELPLQKNRGLTAGDQVRFSLEHGHGECLLCGASDPWSLRLQFIPDGAGGVQTRFDAHPGLQGYDGIVHGGVIAALLDAAMTHCLFHHGISAVTGDLHVRFVQQVRIDATTDIRAWILSSAKRLHRLRAELVDGGSVAAWAEATFVARSESSGVPRF